MSYNIVGNKNGKVNVAKIEDLDENLFTIFKGSSKILIIEVDTMGHQIGKARSTTVIKDYKSFMAAVAKNMKRVSKDKSNVLTVEQIPVHSNKVEFVDPENTSGVNKKQAAVITTIIALVVVFGIYLLF